MSVHLTVSSTKFDDKCLVVARSLQKSGVATALVVPGVTTIGAKITEPACIITLPYDKYGAGPLHKSTMATMWRTLSDDLNLTCAFLNIEGRYAGCVLNYLRPTACSF